MFTTALFEEFYNFSDVIADNGTEFVATIDVPGVSKEDITLDIQDGYLEVKAERKSNKTVKTRYVKVSNKVDQQNIKASLTDGVLTVTLPKKKQKKIEITVE